MTNYRGEPTPPTTAADLTELRRLLEGATDGPWQWLDGDGEAPDELQDGHGEMVATAFRDDVLPDVTDGRLCAALRNAAPALLDLAEARQENGSALREFPTATPRPWTVDTLEGGGWAVVVDADGAGGKVIAELDDTYGDRAANATLIVEAVNAAALPPSAPPALDKSGCCVHPSGCPGAVK